MIVPPEEARRIIVRHYGPEFKYRILSRSATIGVRPVSDPRPTLVWRRLSPGQDSAIVIGVLKRNNDINWEWDGTTYTITQA